MTKPAKPNYFDFPTGAKKHVDHPDKNEIHRK